MTLHASSQARCRISAGRDPLTQPTYGPQQLSVPGFGPGNCPRIAPGALFSPVNASPASSPKVQCAQWVSMVYLGTSGIPISLPQQAARLHGATVTFFRGRETPCDCVHVLRWFLQGVGGGSASAQYQLRDRRPGDRRDLSRRNRRISVNPHRDPYQAKGSGSSAAIDFIEDFRSKSMFTQLKAVLRPGASTSSATSSRQSTTRTNGPSCNVRSSSTGSVSTSPCLLAST